MQDKTIEICDFDFDHKKQVTPKSLQRFKGNMHNQDFVAYFDSDVQQAIKQHNTPKDRERLNTMIRLLFATA